MSTEQEYLRTGIILLDEITIAGAPPKRHRAFPAIHRLQNGEILCAFREGSDHWVTPDGTVRLTRSTDGGHTWSQPITIRQEANWNWGQHHAMTQLSDGTILLPVTRLRSEYHRPDGTVVIGPRVLKVFLPDRHTGLPFPGQVFRRAWYMLRSHDNGQTWPDSYEIMVPGLSSEGSPDGQPWGKIRELDDGRVMMPISGVIDGVPHAGVAFSSDKGKTWDSFSTTAADPETKASFNETDITRLSDGRLIALIRQDTLRPFYLYQSYSEDDGKTWTPAQPTTIEGHCPCVYPLPSGAIICVYRDKRPKKEGVSISISHNNGENWHYVGQYWTSPGYTNDCGYPSMLTLPNGDILCAFYTPFIEANNEIHAWILRESSPYAP